MTFAEVEYLNLDSIRSQEATQQRTNFADVEVPNSIISILKNFDDSKNAVNSKVIEKKEKEVFTQNVDASLLGYKIEEAIDVEVLSAVLRQSSPDMKYLILSKAEYYNRTLLVLQK